MNIKSRIRNFIIFWLTFFYFFRFFKKITFKELSFYLLLDRKNGYVDREFISFGIYEKEIFSLIYSLSDKNKVFIDVWANIGQYTNFAPPLFKSVIAFEPIPRIYSQNLTSIHKNNFTNVSLYNFGLWNFSGYLPIYENYKNIWNSSLCPKVWNNRYDLLEYVEIKKGDDIIKGAIHLIKIDVEGYELYVLQGMNNLIELNHPDIIMEFSPFFYKKINWNVSNLILSFLANKWYFIYEISSTLKPVSTDDLLSRDRLNIYCTARWIR